MDLAEDHEQTVAATSSPKVSVHTQELILSTSWQQIFTEQFCQADQLMTTDDHHDIVTRKLVEPTITASKPMQTSMATNVDKGNKQSYMQTTLTDQERYPDCVAHVIGLNAPICHHHCLQNNLNTLEPHCQTEKVLYGAFKQTEYASTDSVSYGYEITPIQDECLEITLREEFGVVTADIQNALERRGKTAYEVLLGMLGVYHEKRGALNVANKHDMKHCDAIWQHCKDAEDIPDLFYKLHNERYISILHTQLLENIIEAFDLQECREDLDNYHQIQLIPYLRSCEAKTYDQNDFSKPELTTKENNRKSTVLNLSGEWNNLSLRNAELARRKIALLLDLDEACLQIHCQSSKHETLSNNLASGKTPEYFNQKILRQVSNEDKSTWQRPVDVNIKKKIVTQVSDSE